MSLVIASFSATDKVPGFVGETVLGAGPISLASIPLTLLICGLKKTGFATGLTPDVDVVDILSADDADTYWGPGGEGARMAYAALRVPGIKIKGCAPTPGNTPTAATATITIAGPATASGTWAYRIGGDLVTGGHGASDTATAIGAAIAAAIQAKPRMTASASASSGVVTLTWKSSGPRGNQGTVFQQISGLGTGVTSTLAGGAALASSTGGESGVYFSSGATAESVTAMLATLYPARYNRIAAAQNDTTNAALWSTQMTNKAAPLEGREEGIVFGFNGTLSASQTLGKTTMNNGRAQVAWLLNSESHPSEVAAVFAALRTATEQGTPNVGYDGTILPGIAPQASRADWAQRTTQSSALDNGTTPLVTDEQGNVRVCRSITTHCLNGSDPDYRTLDTAEPVVDDYVRDDLRLLWTTSFVVANPYVRDNPSDLERDPPTGVATPNAWNAAANAELLELQRQLLLTSVETNPPYSEFNKTAGRIMSEVPVIRLPLQHAIGVSVRGLSV